MAGFLPRKIGDMDKKLANGLAIRYQDESKKLAADRWLIKLRCQAFIPVQDWMREALAGDDPCTAFCRRELGKHLAYEVVLERNFIDECEGERVRQELVGAFESSVLSYLEKEVFVRQLFATHRVALEERYARLAWSEAGSVVEEGDETPGPADFSACFR